ASASVAPTASDPSTPWGEPNVRLGEPIGDGSQAPSPDPQPFQRPITKLAAGEKPPQFVVFSWDGASGNENYILDMVKRAHSVNGTMTLFLSALYMLPQSKKKEYQPPRRPAGDSDIPYMSDLSVRRTIVDTGEAWKYGNEIGTHFCGHFQDPNGVPSWTSKDWEQEISQVFKLVTHWRTNTGWTDIEPLPFDYTKECVGARTPLLAGRETLLPVAKRLGWRYDTSGTRGSAAWPKKDAYGIYDMSMFSVPFRGKGTILPMDYNYYVAHTKATNTGSSAQRQKWKAEHRASLVAGLELCLSGNRAPLIIGNHLSPWLGGIYQDNLRELIVEFGQRPDVQLVSHRWLCDWLDAQDPEVLAELQAS
ncbi:MAG: hypothetical protein WAV45_01440, partial [Propionibacteriaceae bacterium]